MSKVYVSDLDGTLIKTDLLYEALLILIKKNFFYVFLLPLWFLSGKAKLKQQIFSRIEIDPDSLIYNEELIEYLKEKKSKGNKLVLATASPLSAAKKVADYLNLFDEVYGSNENMNLRSDNKAKLLVEKYGEKGFIYAGDSDADLAVWDNSEAAITVNKNINSKYKIEKEFNTKNRSYPKSIIKQIRVYQWVKNVLLFLPALMAHSLDFSIYQDLIFAFLSFSITASSVYVLNDLLDLASDRKHPRKRKRPFASGDIPILHGIAMFPALIIAGFGIAFIFLPLEFVVSLTIYYIITTLYSFKLKKLPLVDVLTLASLYTIRIISGGKAADIEISPWLLAFSMFIFMSLAFLKRYTELLVMISQNKEKASGRGYQTGDSNLIMAFGAASGMMSVLVFALYTNSAQVKALYTNTELLLLINVFLVYWITRIWLMAHRGKMTDDPIVFTGKDKNSWVIGILIAAITLLAN
jgi:4-hydroxybenzoate polyprenyltransferase